LRDFFGHAQELLGGGGKGASAAINLTQLALDTEFLDVHLTFDFAARPVGQ
jgi:hypothetical protein